MTARRLLLALALGLFAAPAARACDARLERLASDPTVPFDPFSGEAGALTLDLAVRNIDGAACRLGLAVVSARQGPVRRTDPVSGHDLTYLVETEGGGEYLNQATGYLPLATSGGLARLRLRVPSNQLVEAGDYSDILTLQLVDLDSGRALAAGTLRLPLTIAVPARAEANIAGAVGSFPSSPFATSALNFGELEQGESRTAYLQVRATRAVSIRIESQNRGAMRPLDRPGEQGLAYALTVAGQPVEVVAGAQTITGHPPLTMDGESYPMVVRITGSPATLPAGHYQDVISIDVTPN